MHWTRRAVRFFLTCALRCARVSSTPSGAPRETRDMDRNSASSPDASLTSDIWEHLNLSVSATTRDYLLDAALASPHGRLYEWTPNRLAEVFRCSSSMGELDVTHTVAQLRAADPRSHT